MPVFVCLLRGVNVGGRNRLKMADLRALLAEMGLQDVSTYIQSGNVVFRGDGEARGLGDQIAAHLARALSFAPRVLVVPAEALDTAIRDCPYGEAATADPKSVHLFFLATPPTDAAADALAAAPAGADRWTLAPGVGYLHTPDGLSQSPLATRIERILRVDATARNWRSALAIQALAQQISTPEAP